MNIAVYFYDEEGKYTHMDMVYLEFDEEGNKILPKGCTDIFPLDLSTDPHFSVELGKWIPQKAVPPYASDQQRADIEALRREIENLKSGVSSDTLSKRLTRLEEDYNRTKYYLGVVLPNAKHYFQ
ncbi:hypothetical protein PDK35_02420 [Bacillus cereus group sp. TH153LC]|uniref:hypothetical protein n=1 Tax=Bacillus cereus group sp. TH153LC TaxID=3018059 RepID=UPI0022E61766|nr:hypothetical protein [Bacillus cereus group sp. TH153LC]MDA1658830.1 hypothetical protein [Bacillus cereus group sp. TH153LC]